MAKKIDRRRVEMQAKKIRFLKYFSEVPILKFAAASIGMDENTVGAWRRSDLDFSSQIEDLKAKYVQSQLKGIKSREWKLERMFRDPFAARSDVNVSGDISLSINDSLLLPKTPKKPV